MALPHPPLESLVSFRSIVATLRAAFVATGVGVLLAACEGQNCFRTPTGTCGGPGPTDTTSVVDSLPPTVLIELPDDSAIVAAGDSVFVQVHATDNRRVASITLEGYALRGDPNLGTGVIATRFVSKTIDLSGIPGPVRDTVVQRYLNATVDSTPERQVRIVATVRDTMGLVDKDSVVIHIGGPRIEIVAPTAAETFAAGTQIPVHIRAEDHNDRVRSVRVRVTGLPTPFDQTIQLASPVEVVDTTLIVPLPLNTTGPAVINAEVTSGANITAVARPVTVGIRAASPDASPPQVRFNVSAPARMERSDTITVYVNAVDDQRVDSIGVTAAFRFGGGVFYFQRPPSAAAVDSFKIPLSLVTLTASDTTQLRIEITAWAVDPTHNCGAAVSPNILQSLPCGTVSGSRVAAGLNGFELLTLVSRGSTVATIPGDVIADLASDGARVYASNYSRNRVEVLPVFSATFATPVSVGSNPWGLAIGRTGDSLLVANSGGTNIDAVALSPAGPTGVIRRLGTADVEIYDLLYSVEADTVTELTALNFSDRPQFLGQVTTGQIVYSTLPTATAANGTIRIYDPNKDVTQTFNRGTEIFDQYVTRTQGKAIVVNALSAGAGVNGTLIVCPRKLYTAQSDPPCVQGFVTDVANTLDGMRTAMTTDTRVDLGLDAETIGLSDTTFVAISRDRSSVAFGEGARNPGRVMLFRSAGGVFTGSSRETADLINNAADKVIGLALNGDGSLGVARGQQVYFFDNQLRLQGVVASGSPTGGTALHPLNTGYPSDDGRRLGFTSGIENGTPYIDVIDDFSFRSLRRLVIRDPVIGSMIAVPVQAGDPEFGVYELRLFALTSRGILRIGLTAGPTGDLSLTPD
jgi:hypothetical protein